MLFTICRIPHRRESETPAPETAGKRKKKGGGEAKKRCVLEALSIHELIWFPASLYPLFATDGYYYLNLQAIFPEEDSFGAIKQNRTCLFLGKMFVLERTCHNFFL